MTIIVFLVDTSASMYQRAYLGGRPSILDVAKNAVETFVKVRQRSQESRGDRYMLLTFEDPPNNIKAGWKENLSTFMNELKNLQCLGLTSMGSALKHTFDVLNLNRMQTGIDTYGQGRCPFYLEPSVILVITDGGKLSSLTGVQDDFNLPMHSPIPGSELTREPFRWDQRLFALVLRLSGTPANERDIGLVPCDNSPIDAMCEVTGGRSYCITSHRMMMQCIDSLVQKVQSGVVINFEKIGPDPSTGENNRDEASINPLIINHDDETEMEISATPMLTEAQQLLPPLNKVTNAYTLPAPIPSSSISWHSCRKMIFVPRSAQKGFAVGFWPIPESFWPDINVSILPARSAHPNVKFTCVNQEPMVIENLPFDKYELEPSPLTQYILARKQPTICWQVFVPNSYKNSEVGHPFGYLKASTNLTCVNLFVMPYNYPVLLPLLDDLFKVLRLKQSAEWTAQFRNYMRTMPSYYVGPLRRALTRMGAPNSLAQTLIPDHCEATLGVTVLNYVKKLKNQAKIEFDRLCNDVLSKQNAQSKLTQQSTSPVNNLTVSVNTGRVRVVPRAVLKRDLVTHPNMHDKFMSSREQLNEYGGFVVGLPTSRTNLNTKSFRNPYHINRSNLLDQVVRMRSNYLQPANRMKLIDDDVTHSLPVNQMGNYQEYLKRMPPALREIESTPVRQHMFGNPFKIDKRMMVDEADIDLVTSNNSSSSSGALTGSSPLTMKQAKRLMSNSDQKAPPPKRKPGPIPKEVVVRRPSIILPTSNTHISTTNTTQISTPSVPITVNTVPVLSSPSPFSFNDVKEELPGIQSVEDTKQVPLPPVIRNPAVNEQVENVNDVDKEMRETLITSTPPPLSFNIINNEIRPRVESIPLLESYIEPEITPPIQNDTVPVNSIPPSLPPLQPSTYQISDYLSPLNYNNYSLSEDVINESGQFVYTNNTTNDQVNHDCNNDIKFEKRHYNSINNNGITDSVVDSPCPVLETDPELQKHNSKIKKMLFQDVRKPGKDFSGLWDHIMLLKGEFYIQEVIIKQVHNEALRFKRQALARAINAYLEITRIDSIHNTSNSI